MASLSKVFLTRGTQEAILQGMIHIGPEELYEKLQKDIDLVAKKDYRIFFEGVRSESYDQVGTVTVNEKNIGDFFHLLIDMYPILADALGIGTQKEKIVYPNDAINADITFAEFARQLDRNGFKCSFLLKVFRKITENEEMKKNIAEKISKELNPRDFIGKSDKWSFGKMAAQFTLRKAMPIMLDYRNEAAFSVIHGFTDRRNIFIHYGEKHIKGLVQLFCENDWLVRETIQIELMDFC